jgi:alkylhydroperoxidase family enzyme
LPLQGEDAQITAPVRDGDLAAATALDDPHRELLRFVERVTRHAWRTMREDIERLRGAGWSLEQIAEAVCVTAMFAMFNRVADAFGLPDPGDGAAAGSASRPG